METIIYVTCDAVAGRDDEMNAWYTWVHIRDVMKLPGSIAVQRFSQSPVQPRSGRPTATKGTRYLALYELDDKAACTHGHAVNIFTDRMPISDAFDFGAFFEAYQDPVEGAAEADFSAGSGELSVLFARLNVQPGQANEFENHFRNRLRSRIQEIPGISSANLFRHGTDQAIPLPARHSHLLVCHLSNLSLASLSWDSSINELLSSRPVELLEATIYQPLFPRLTAKRVVNAPAAEHAMADCVRAGLGDRVHTVETFNEAVSNTSQDNSK